MCASCRRCPASPANCRAANPAKGSMRRALVLMVRERAPDRAGALPEECATDPEGGLGRFDYPVNALSEGLSACLLGCVYSKQ